MVVLLLLRSCSLVFRAAPVFDFVRKSVLLLVGPALLVLLCLGLERESDLALEFAESVLHEHGRAFGLANDVFNVAPQLVGAVEGDADRVGEVELLGHGDEGLVWPGGRAEDAP